MKLQLTVDIDERQLRDLIRRLESTDDATPDPPTPGASQLELPPAWRLVEERHGVRYTWGEDAVDVYDPFVVYEGSISTGPARLGIGKCERTRVHGDGRIYYIVCLIGPQGGLRAIAEFLATDDYERTGDVVAVIKGKDGTGRYFDPGDRLPEVYAPWVTVVYRDRVDYPGSYKKLGLVCSEVDHEVMLNHALAQIQLRQLDA